MALAVAGAVDMLQIAVVPLFLAGYAIEDFLDVVAAVILVAICGFKWQFAAGFFLELVPVVNIFPTWTALVLTLPSHEEPVRQNVTVTSVPPRQQGDVIDVDAVVIPPVKAGGAAQV
ncbi:MAG TPA: hypothetical protein VHM90_00205 [Phycisphaerae bacterium]|nr:hypothetical protein [Phycisphaerae bacterium]